MDIIKISDSEIKVIATETINKENTYSYDFLLSQKKAIQDQKDRDNLQRDKELAEVEELLLECGKLGLKTQAEIEAEKPIEELTP